MSTPASQLRFNEDGSIYNSSAPLVTQKEYFDEEGKPIDPNTFKLIQGKPSFNISPGTEGIAPALMGALPVAGAGLGSLVGGPGGGIAGAGLGSSLAETFKKHFPETFSETGKPPTERESGTNIATNAITEGGNQIISSLVRKGVKPAIAELFASKAGQMIPGIKNATMNAKVVDALESAAERKTYSNPAEADAVKDALGKGSRGGRITNPDAISAELNSKDNRGIISEGTKKNLNDIMDMAQKTTDPDTPKGSIYLGKAGLIIGTSLANHAAGAVAGGLILTNEGLAHLAANPEISKLIIEGMKLPPESAKAKLIRQGILYSLRGTEQYMMDSNGEKHKVVISKEGVPQLPRQ